MSQESIFKNKKIEHTSVVIRYLITLLIDKKYYALIFIISISTGFILGNSNVEYSDFRFHFKSEIPLNAGSGLSSNEWEFVRKFDKPILRKKDFDLPLDKVRSVIYENLYEDYNDNINDIHEWFEHLTNSEKLISYLTLRSGLSLPILDSGKRLTGNYSLLLGSESGNCNQHAYRAAFLLDAFGYFVRHVTLSSPPYIMGHAVADVYDPKTRTAALIDSNKNFIFFLRGVNQSFFETILPIEDIDDRRAILDTVHVQRLPNTTKFFIPSTGHLNGWQNGKKPPITLEHVWHANSLGPEKTMSAFIDGYQRLITKKTRNKEHWWLRINDISRWTEASKSGISGLQFYDNTEINAVLTSLRRKLGASLEMQ
jgi:hypothetical protein